MLTDRPERFLAAELIREKVFRLSGEEIPYGSEVMIDKFEQEGNLRRIIRHHSGRPARVTRPSWSAPAARR